MIEVYVREVNDLKGELLGEFEPKMLPQLVQSFKEYRTYLSKPGTLALGENSGQYVVDESGVYFEILVEVELGP